MKITRKWRRAWKRGNPAYMRSRTNSLRQRHSAKKQAVKPSIKATIKRIVPNFVKPAAIAAGVALAVLTGNPSVEAMPTSGQVTDGKGSITQNGSNMTITQSTDKMAVNWQSFGIAKGESVRFNQPSVNSVALNKVIGNDPSNIYGQLSANGKVFLVNQNGIYFSPTAQVDVGGLVASTLNINNSDFMNGKYAFSKTGNGTAGIVNQGNIRTADGGYVALLGDQVINEGVIIANKGSVALGAGSSMTLDFAGDGLINLNVNQGAVNALAENKNLVQADGGLVVMTAKSAGDLIGTVVNNSGIIQAKSLTNVNGVIRLDGGTSGTVAVSGTLDASGKDAGQTGGTVKVLGSEIGVTNAVVDASGNKGGGTVLVGGNYQGKGSEQNAANTTVGKDVTIKADAVTEGKGGTVVVWADNKTQFDGAISAKGGSLSGDGGLIETSGKILDIGAGMTVTAEAKNGKGGEWLLDPYDYTVNAAEASQIGMTLNNGTSVTISTAASTAAVKDGALTGVSGSGDITVTSQILKNAGGDATLTLRADRNIIINSHITSTAGKLNLTLSAANADGATAGGVSVNGNLASNGGNILIGGNTGTVTNGIGFARNLFAITPKNTDNPAVLIGASQSILSGGGNITINGHSTLGQSSGSYESTQSGVYIKSGAKILSGIGNLYITGEESGGANTFGIGFEANSGTVSTIGTSTTAGSMILNAKNTTSGQTQAILDQGALGLTNNGGAGAIVFNARSVAQWFIKVNGSAQQVTYAAPTLQSGPYPYVGMLTVPGSNGSYLRATYNTVDSAYKAIYVITNDGSRTYNGTTNANDVVLTTLGAPAGFSTSKLGTLAFSTSSSNVGAYADLIASPSNSLNYTDLATLTPYAVGYYSTGTYTINKALLTISTSNVTKVYDGGLTAAGSPVATSGVLYNNASNGNILDSISGGTFAFTNKNVGAGNKTVTVSGVTVNDGNSGNNYTVTYANNTTSTITAKPLTVNGITARNKEYDGTTVATVSGSATLTGVIDGDTVSFSGTATGEFADKNAGTNKAVTISGISLSGSDAGNYTVDSTGSVKANITPLALTVDGFTADNKVYDGNRTAVVAGTMTNKVDGDTLTLIGIFSDKNVADGKTVTGGLSGTDAGNYSLTKTTTANITPKALTISGTVTASDKIYDGNTSAVVDGSKANLGGIIDSDAVTLSAAGTFDTKNVGTGKPVAVTLAGTDTGNYSLSYSTTAKITPRTLILSNGTVTADDKPYDGNTNAAIKSSGPNFSNIVPGDTVNVGTTGTFDTKDVGNRKTVNVGLTGSDSGNYQYKTTASIIDDEKKKTAEKVSNDEATRVFTVTVTNVAPITPNITVESNVAVGVTAAISGNSVALTFQSPITTEPVNRAITLLSVGTDGPRVEGNYNLSASGASMTITPTAQGRNAVPPLPADNAPTAQFTVTTATGGTVDFLVTYADGALSIKPRNPSAAAIDPTDAALRKTIAANGAIVAHQELGVGINSIDAIYIH